MLRRYIFVYFLCIVFAFSITSDYWLYTEKVSLKKDAFYTAWIYRDKGSNKEHKKMLYFRWTLFHNNALTMHLNLEKFNHQFVLKQNMFKDSFKLTIFDSFAGLENPFLFIKFESFDLKNKQANFTFLIRDEFGSTVIEKMEGKK